MRIVIAALAGGGRTVGDIDLKAERFEHFGRIGIAGADNERTLAGTRLELASSRAKAAGGISAPPLPSSSGRSE